MNARSLRMCVLLTAAVLSPFQAARASTIQFLTPAGSSTGIAYGVDGLNVVGQDVLQRGFLYNGATNKYTVIQPPGGGSTVAYGISGNKIVGSWGKLGFLFDGVNYTTLSDPLGVNGTAAYGISGNTIVGTYIDASNKAHGFVFDGSTYTTLNDPFGGISAHGISGNNIVGGYTDSKNRTHGFLFNGTTWTTLDDPFFLGTGLTVAYGIDGSKVVGFTISSPFSAAFIYDGASYSHPFSVEYVPDHIFYGISGNRIVGDYNDQPFVYVIPEPNSLVLAFLGFAGLLLVSLRKRSQPR